jgi:hypothetical protein
MKPLIVQGKYQLDLRLGSGSYGEVYQGMSLSFPITFMTTTDRRSP